jgi:hypothetical protein
MSWTNTNRRKDNAVANLKRAIDQWFDVICAGLGN